MAGYYLASRRLWASLTDAEQLTVMLQATADGHGVNTPPSDQDLARRCAARLRARGMTEEEIEAVAIKE